MIEQPAPVDFVGGVDVECELELLVDSLGQLQVLAKFIHSVFHFADVVGHDGLCEATWCLSLRWSGAEQQDCRTSDRELTYSAH